MTPSPWRFRPSPAGQADLPTRSAGPDLEHVRLHLEPARRSPGVFDGVVLVNGSHVDSVLGVNPFFDAVLQLVADRVPAGNTAATYTLSTGWINDFYTPGPPAEPAIRLLPRREPADHPRPAAGVGLPTVTLNQTTLLGTALESATDFIFKLFGIPPTPKVNTGTNGVTALVTPAPDQWRHRRQDRDGDPDHSVRQRLQRPRQLVLPTQADGSVQANGVIWLHGSGLQGTGTPIWRWHWPRDQQHRRGAVQIFWFDDAFSGQAAAEMFLGTRPALNISASQAGFEGTLPEKFILTGTRRWPLLPPRPARAPWTTGAAANLLGVVMFDGVDGAEEFAARWPSWTASASRTTRSRPRRRAGTPGAEPPSNRPSCIRTSSSGR